MPPKPKRDIIRELQDIGKDIIDKNIIRNINETMEQPKPHTYAKHKILSEYLKRWYPILGSWNSELVYIDGFAGSGIYKDGSLGSPLIAYYTFVTHRDYPNTLSMKKAEFIFIEKDASRANTLKSVLNYVKDILKNKGYQISSNTIYRVYTQEFEKIIKGVIKGISERKVALFAFIDPYGYTQYTLPTIIEILKYQYSSEILLNFMTGFMDRFISDKNHLDTIKEELGLTQDQIQDILNTKNMEERSKKLVNILYSKIYEEFKKYNTGKKIYYQSFTILSKNNTPLYELVHLTKHEKGVEEMKKSMIEASNVAGLKFSDYYYDPKAVPITNFIYSKRSEEQDEEAAKYIYNNLCNKVKQISLKELKSYVIIETPYVWRKNILKILTKKYKVREVRGKEDKIIIC